MVCTPSVRLELVAMLIPRGGDSRKVRYGADVGEVVWQWHAECADVELYEKKLG
jgi:hypothetical protein